MQCRVNGLELNFIFDTGASNVSISLAEAIFMLKNGYIETTDIRGSEYYKIANGEVQEGTKLILRRLEIGGIVLTDIEASIVHSLDAPLLLGQSALSRLGKIEFDYGNNTLTINKSSSSYNYSQGSSSNADSSQGTNNSYTYRGNYLFETGFKIPSPMNPVPLRSQPNVNGDVVYECPIDSKVYVLSMSKQLYLRVHVNGYTGYIAKGLLKRIE